MRGNGGKQRKGQTMATSKRSRKYGGRTPKGKNSPEQDQGADEVCGEIRSCMRPARICQHCGAAETLKTYKSIMVGVVRVAWARCSECRRVTKEKTIVA